MTKRLCEDCGKEISEVRLEALPDTRLCIKCASENDEPPRMAFLTPDPDAPYPNHW